MLTWKVFNQSASSGGGLALDGIRRLAVAAVVCELLARMAPRMAEPDSVLRDMEITVSYDVVID